MASSKVEIAASAAPFGCVLRDHNWRDRINRNNRENNNNVKTTFQNKLKFLVQDHHIHTSISNSTPHQNSQNAGNWLDIQENNTSNNDKMTTAINRQSGCKQRENSPSLSDDGSNEVQNMGCVSSLVQRWREFADTRHSNRKSNNPNSSSSSPSSPVCSISHSQSSGAGKSSCYPQNASLNGDITTGVSVDERFDTPSMIIEGDSFMDWDSDRTAQTGLPSAQSRNSEDGGERERLRVADVIRKLKLENAPIGGGIESTWNNQEQRCFSPVISSSPRIRGRQAFNDLLMQLERDRHKELETLVERRAVSRFSHRGRIQSLLRLRFLRREAPVREAPVRCHHQPHSRNEGAIGTHSRVVGSRHHSCYEARVGKIQHLHSSELSVQLRSGCEEAMPGPQQLSYSTTKNRNQEHSCHEEATAVGKQESFSSPTEIDAQQCSKTQAIVGKQEESHLEAVDGKKNLHIRAASRDMQHSHSVPSESNQNRQGSAVVILREKFNVKDKHGAANPKNPQGIVKSNIFDVKNSSASNKHREELHHHEEVASQKDSLSSSRSNSTYEQQYSCLTRISVLNEPEELTDPSSYAIRQETNFVVHNTDSQELAERLTISNGWVLNKNPEEHDKININSVNHWEDQETNNAQIRETDEDLASVDSQYWSEWREEGSNNLHVVHDWVSDISRPRSVWEGLRQARYQDMLDSDHENYEMQRLLERRSVSSFLSSNLRDTMDQLMISRVERLPQLTGNQQEEDRGLHKRLEQFVMSHLQKQTNITNSQQGEKLEEEDDTDYSGLVTSPSPEQPQSSWSSCPDTQPFSGLTHHPSIEMEFIHDLRAHMEQLHHEVSELRKSINSCMNMQEKLQGSMKQEVAAAVDRSVGGAMKDSVKDSARKRSCCICCEMQVDSLLYRCGHMCTCFKCAHELQWSTGICPICRAPIVDVVRAYPDGNT